jgi:hypothetical protein
MSLIKLFLGGNTLVFSPPESVWSVTSRLGTGKWLTLFYSVAAPFFCVSAVCPTPCDNGGECSGPGTCSCPPGFTGPHCQQDIDECTANNNNKSMPLAPCGPDGVCVNMPGWHYCACRDGYTAYHNPLDGTAACVDEDECAAGTATCLPPAVCRNTPGGYTCECPLAGADDDGDVSSSSAHGASCSGDCLLRDAAAAAAAYAGGQPGVVIIAEESSWEEGCNSCTCLAGRVTCRPAPCNCRLAAQQILRGCCPECDDVTPLLLPPPGGRTTCQYGGGVYRPGQRWIAHCMECECRGGEVDCWPLACPAGCRSAAESVCCPGGSGDTGERTNNVSIAACGDSFSGGPVAAASKMGPDSFAWVCTLMYKQPPICFVCFI